LSTGILYICQAKRIGGFLRGQTSVSQSSGQEEQEVSDKIVRKKREEEPNYRIFWPVRLSITLGMGAEISDI